MRTETFSPEFDLDTEKLFDDIEPRVDDSRVSPERDTNEHEQAPVPESRSRYEGEKVEDEDGAGEPRVESIIFDELYSSRGGNAEDWREGEYHETYEFRDGKLWKLNGECFTDQIRETGDVESIEEHELWLDHLHERPHEPFSSSTTDYTDDEGALHTYGAVSDGTFVQSRHFIYTEAKAELLHAQDFDTENPELSLDESMAPQTVDLHKNDEEISFAIESVENVEITEAAETSAVLDSVEDMTTDTTESFVEDQTESADTAETTPIREEVSYVVPAVSEVESISQHVEAKSDTPEAEVSVEESMTESTKDFHTLTEPVPQEDVSKTSFQEYEQAVIEAPFTKHDENFTQQESVAENTVDISDTSTTQKTEISRTAEPVEEAENKDTEEIPALATAIESKPAMAKEAPVPKIETSSKESVVPPAQVEKTFEEREVADSATQEEIVAKTEVASETPKESVQEQDRSVELPIAVKIVKDELIETISEEGKSEEIVEVSEVQSSQITESARENEITGEQEVLTNVLNELFTADIFDDMREERTEVRQNQERDKKEEATEEKNNESVSAGADAKELITVGGVGSSTRAARVSRFAANDNDSRNNPRAQIVSRNGIRMERAIAA